MAFLGSNITNEVGLRLLLCPLGSNIVLRTACCSVGIALPVYSTFKAIETKDQDEQRRMLIYWAAYGSFSIVEVFSDKLLSWCPFYYHMKFAFLVWLQLPSADGAKQLYVNHLRPFFLRHQARIDQYMGFAYSEMEVLPIALNCAGVVRCKGLYFQMQKQRHLHPHALLVGRTSALSDSQSWLSTQLKLTSAHQAEIQFARNMVVKIVGSAHQMISGAVKPDQPQHRSAIEGPLRTTSDANSDHDD